MHVIRSNLVRTLVLAAACLAGISGVHAQDKGTLHPQPLPPLANPDDPKTPAKQLFGRKAKPSHQAPEAIGFYAAGCLAGGVGLPHDGPTWQVMRLSRNRNWGTPRLIDFLERFSAKVPRINGWPGLLIGDMAQPRGGPMITGHASHQIGLDADVWFSPMPDHTLSRAEREEMSATNLVRSDLLDIDPNVWDGTQLALIRAVAKESEVQRIFVNAAIKRALCREAGSDRSWLAKVRPMWGHNYHFHVRLTCPPGSETCTPQNPVSGRDECGKELDAWFTPQMLHPKPGKPRPPMTMDKLPVACRGVLGSN